MGWATAFNNDGKPYYYHLETNETRWDAPDVDKAEADAAIAEQWYPHIHS